MRSKNSLYLCLCVLTVLALFFNGERLPAGAQTAPLPQDTVFQVKVPGYRIDAGGIQVPGYLHDDTPGAPVLPVWDTLVELPAEGNWDLSYEVRGSHVLPDRLRLPAAPAPQPLARPQGWPDPSELPAAAPLTEWRNPEIWDTDAFYPSAPVLPREVGWQRGRRLLALRVYPFQYNPVSMKVTYHPEIQVAIRLSSATADVGSLSARATGVEQGYVPRAGDVRVRTAERGFYRLTYDDLLAAGVPVAMVDTRQFAMYYLGEAIDIQVRAAQEVGFQPGDQVIFYAEPYAGRYMTENVYWFTYQDAPGTRMTSRSILPTGEEALSTTITRTLHIERDLDYRSMYERPRQADHWFDNAISVSRSTMTRTVSYPLVLDNPVSEGEVVLRALLHGGAEREQSPDQSLELRLNSHPVGVFAWEGSTDHWITATLPASWLDGAPNRVILEAALSQLPGSNSYWVSPDWIELSYPALAQASLDRLYIEGGAAGSLERIADGFASPDVDVYDVRDVRHPVQLTTTQVQESGSGHAVHFWDADLPYPSYFLTTAAALLAPAAVEPAGGTQWRSPEHSFDYIAVVHPVLWDAIQPLLDHREAEGLRVAKVSVQDIYDQFSHGLLDPEAIRDFLAYAYHEWNGAAGDPPRYVLLVGDGHHDFKGVTPTNLPNLIPPYLISVDPWLGETPADNRYVSIDGEEDYLPDMAIGRLPARDAADVTAMVDKIVAYENGVPDQEWRKRVVYVADNCADEAGDFHELSDEARLGWLPSYYESRTIYFGEPQTCPESSTTDGEVMRTKIKSAFDEGALLVQWFGHSNALRWGTVSFFNLLDPPSLAPNVTWPVTIDYTCWTGYFTMLYNDMQSLAETLVLTPERGAVASLAPTGLHVGGPLSLLQREMSKAIFHDRIERLGPAVMAAKTQYYAGSTIFHDLIDTTILFGDPATRLQLPEAPPPEPTPTPSPTAIWREYIPFLHAPSTPMP